MLFNAEDRRKLNEIYNNSNDQVAQMEDLLMKLDRLLQEMLEKFILDQGPAAKKPEVPG